MPEIFDDLTLIQNCICGQFFRMFYIAAGLPKDDRLYNKDADLYISSNSDFYSSFIFSSSSSKYLS